MTAVFNSPEIQTGVLPFVIACIVGLLLRRRYQRWSGAGVIPGFIISALLINGFNFTPLTGTRKIILITVLAYIVALLFELFAKHLQEIRRQAYLPGFLALLAAAWIVWPLLARIDNIASGLIICVGLLYVVMQVYLFEQFKEDNAKVIASVLSLGIGTGASAIFAASALYGQLSLALANAVAAILILSVHGQARTGSMVSFPASMLLGLLGLATMVFAELPWYTLMILVLIPVIVQSGVVDRLTKNRSVFLSSIILFFVVLLPAVMAVFSVWLTVEDSGY